MDGRTIQSYFKRLFELSYYHKYSIKELEDLPVYELDLYHDMISNAIAEEEKRRQGI